ncbi:DUF2335 domain-containing protein [Longimicrobium sp.]|uniref:DUF2335 domain-containing protein n=1 Tax=Longimicrobium sp. TaxID=2029185 RepID=UPI002BBBB492|nr:DUF2335 domain-containing protein [Longimicrobium sp.]HSU13004.1 DUF2335 domain-containing protein [Longimicrobium sp.]
MGRKHRSGKAGTLPAAREHDIREGRELQPRPSSASIAIPTITQQSFELRKGPIPDADELVRYGHAHPEAPEIILDEFTRQAAHRRKLERRDQSLDRRALEASITSERMGVICALLIALVGFGCATFLVTTGHGVEGTVIFGLDVGALVSAFILGRPRAVQPKPVE